MAKKVIKKEGKMQELRYSNIKLELENLRAQIQPHFFFNTLNNLYNLSLKKSTKAPEIISSLKNIMHYVLYESRQKVPLIKEIRFMNDYFDLERIRHTNPDLIDFKVQGNPKGIEIEALLFLPLIENCFKHALQKDMLENPITISLLIDNNKIVFQTINTLIEDKTDKIGGIGLANVKKRLKLLYGDKQQFDIVKSKDRFIATIIIQL
jgi:LytS/YehU family sensor histidine kinase